MQRLAPLATLLFATLLGFGSFAAFGQANTPPALSEPLAYRISFVDQAGLRALAAELDIWQVDHSAGYAVAPLTADQFRRLQRRYLVEPASIPVTIQTAGQPAGIPGFACYRTVEETSATLAALAAQYPALASVQTVGASWDKTQPGDPAGYDLEVLVATNRARPGPKFRFFLVGAVHARELTTAETATRFVESLLASYGSDPDATWLLDYGELHVLPIANPDGRKQAEAGLLWRKNTNNTAACTSQLPNFSYGVDLNRNSSFQWDSCVGCSSGNSCSQTYRGTSPASEPETQALETYMAGIFADRRGSAPDAAAPSDTQGMMVSLHSYSEYVLFPWGWTTQPAPNSAALYTLGRKFGFYLDYPACQAGAPGCFYPTDGTTDDWAYGELGLPAYTFELGTWFFESCDYFEENILEDTLAALRYAFKSAHAPYQLPAGPEVLALTISTPTVIAGEIISVTALADDTRSYGGAYGSEPAQAIKAARSTFDALPWQLGASPAAATAGDSVFDTAVEDVQFQMQTSCWTAGRHSLFVQAQDADGNWGVPSAHFVDVVDGRGFVLCPVFDSLTTHPLQPASYTLGITNTGAVTATYTVTVPTSPWDVALEVTELGPLSPGSSAQLTLQISPPLGAVTGTARSIVVVCSAGAPGNCLETILSTTVQATRLVLPFIPHSR
jgi:hypothetical protein